MRRRLACARVSLIILTGAVPSTEMATGKGRSREGIRGDRAVKESEHTWRKTDLLLSSALILLLVSPLILSRRSILLSGGIVEQIKKVDELYLVVTGLAHCARVRELTH